MFIYNVYEVLSKQYCAYKMPEWHEFHKLGGCPKKKYGGGLTEWREGCENWHYIYIYMDKGINIKSNIYNYNYIRYIIYNYIKHTFKMKR